MHLNGLWWCLCRVVGAARFLHVLVGELRPLLPEGNALVLIVDPDQPTALSLASVGGRNLDACACFLGATWRGVHGLSYELLWAL